MPANLKLFGTYKGPHRIFIETGSYCGDGIQLALDAGFEQIHSIEISERHYIACCCRFETDSRVKVHHGDSGTMLAEVMAQINEPVMLWLDGHWSGGDTGGSAMHETPLMEELDALLPHPIKTHTILVDDVLAWKKEKPGVGFGMQELFEKIRRINEGYRFHMDTGEGTVRDVLTARIAAE